jgi:hypothetical protein
MHPFDKTNLYTKSIVTILVLKIFFRQVWPGYTIQTGVLLLNYIGGKRSSKHPRNRKQGILISLLILINMDERLRVNT